MSAEWTSWLTRWADAGLIDQETAARIRAFEQQHAGSGRLRWPVLVALAFGGLMMAGGVLLFVAAHWDALSPTQRFALVLLLVAGFHVGGAFAADRFAGMAGTLHAIGTAALGAGIGLAGQIFNLNEHWPSGLMLWALGATFGWILLGQTAQLVLVATLAPAWLASEWIVAAEPLNQRSSRVLACGIFLLAVCYFTAASSGHVNNRRRALVWLGGISLSPAALFLTSVVASNWWGWRYDPPLPPWTLLQAVGWAVAIGAPLMLAFLLRRTAAWPNAVAVAWVLALFSLPSIAGRIALYAWWAIGAIAFVAWGVLDGRTERVNMGAAIFAGTVIAFYFSEVMDKLGRSASLLGLGLLFLAGGWALERIRRRLVLQARELP